MPLNSAKLRNIKPRDKTQRLYDEKGLYLEVTSKVKPGGVLNIASTIKKTYITLAFP